MTSLTTPQTNWHRYEADAAELKRQAASQLERIAAAICDERPDCCLATFRAELTDIERAHSSKILCMNAIADRELPVPDFK